MIRNMRHGQHFFFLDLGEEFSLTVGTFKSMWRLG